MKKTLRLVTLCLILACLLPYIALNGYADTDTELSMVTEEPVSVDTIRDYGYGNYGFTTFEELEWLLNEYGESLQDLYYEGSADLVIARSLTFTSPFTCIHAENSRITIPAGVTLEMEDGSIYVNDLVIYGHTNAGFIEVDGELTVDGSLTVEWLRINDPFSFTGRENISGDSYYEILCRFSSETADDFYANLEKAASFGDEHLRCYVSPYSDSLVIDRDCTIPRYTSISPRDSFTVASGCTLTLEGELYTWESDFVFYFYGNIINNGTLDVNSGTAWFADDACYSGYGELSLYCTYFENDITTIKQDFREQIPGLDLSRFKIYLRYDDELQANIYDMQLRTCMPHNFESNVCTVCGWDKRISTVNTIDGVCRLAGATRVETALKSADLLKETLGVEYFDNVVVASAKNYPDALAGSHLAACLKAPILLTMDGYHEMVLEYIRDNVRGTVYILGGYTAVSGEFSNELLWYSQVRLAGTDRFDTNLKILNSVGIEEQPLLVCTAYGFADSLSISATGYPVLLVGNALTDAQKEYLSQQDLRSVYIIGGTAAVSSTVEEEIAQYATYVERLAGKNRYETSVMVAEEFFRYPSNAVLAYSENFPDGLSGGPLAYCLNSPLLLNKSGNYTCASFLNFNEIFDGCIMGSDELINDATARKLFNAYQIDVR